MSTSLALCSRLLTLRFWYIGVSRTIHRSNYVIKNATTLTRMDKTFIQWYRGWFCVVQRSSTKHSRRYYREYFLLGKKKNFSSKHEKIRSHVSDVYYRKKLRNLEVSTNGRPTGRRLCQQGSRQYCHRQGDGSSATVARQQHGCLTRHARPSAAQRQNLG